MVLLLQDGFKVLSIDVMVPKKVGSLSAAQLQTIVIMESDFTFADKKQNSRAEGGRLYKKC